MLGAHFSSSKSRSMPIDKSAEVFKEERESRKMSCAPPETLLQSLTKFQGVV